MARSFWKFVIGYGILIHQPTGWLNGEIRRARENGRLGGARRLMMERRGAKPGNSRYKMSKTADSEARGD